MPDDNKNSKKNLFQISPESNIFGTVTSMNDTFSPFIDPINYTQTSKYSKSINDLDSSLILENIDKKATNKIVKIDLKIKTLEKNLARVNDELELLLLLNLPKDKQKVRELMKFKAYIEHQLAALKSDKNKFGIFYYFVSFYQNKVILSYLKKLILKLVMLSEKYFHIFIRHLKNTNLFNQILKRQ